MSYGPPPPGNPGPPSGGYGTGGYGPPPGGYGPPSGGQPGFGGQPPAGAEPPKTYLWMNIVGIFTCTVAGIIGLIFALQVNSKWQMGDYAGAESSSNTAKITGIISLVGLGLWVAYFAFIIIMMVVAMNSPTAYP
ncbi:CD225/dispanin family protein [Nocardiopsis sp. MG754419]|uniref:CD225/dispanin family protein n=1 Tax=Nocardiopsis sp. MG754419 TaxID=2259865 RepID=UPI001BAAE34C|nr:CD225/dispanin family protein [Nocardiopsis sp. MG754419]MBR8741527.1 CD225/dispanin family protein [Nocardiopsis sp. MG754419]